MTLYDTLAAAAAILFDLFHTLTAVETTNVPLPRESWEIMGLDREAWARARRPLELPRLRGEIADPYALLAIPARAARPGVEERAIRQALQTRQEKFARALRDVDPEVVETLAVLRRRGKKLGLVSNADHMEIAAWPESPLAGCFDATVFSCQVGAVKPEREIYLLACDALTVDPAACLFVGDGGADELGGARALGMATVQVTGILSRFWPHAVEERGAQADYRIETIRELADERRG